MTDTFYYKVECTYCETETRVMVVEEDELPGFCSMCGLETEAEPIEEDDYIMS